MANNVQPILIIDSGLGGLYFAKNLFSNISCEQIIYFADDEYMPYGNKSKKNLRTRLDEIIKYFIEYYNPKIIIFACNTAGVIYNKFLKNRYKIPIFCVSVLHSYTTNSLILSTKMTQKILIENEEVANNCEIKYCSKLASDIEKYFFNKRKLSNIIKKLEIKNNQDIVLGCTHYELIQKEFKEIFPNSTIICPSNFCLDKVLIFLEKYYQNKKQKDKVENIKTLETKQISFLCSTGSKSYTDKLKLIFHNYLN